MNNTAYTSEQLSFAIRISKAMAGVPRDRLPALETIIESILIGASIAASGHQSAKRENIADSA